MVMLIGLAIDFSACQALFPGEPLAEYASYKKRIN